MWLRDNVVLLTPSGGGLQLALEWFTAECEVAGLRISTSKSETIIHKWNTLEFPLHPEMSISGSSYK